MPDVLTFLFIVMVERIGKTLRFSFKVMWVFIKFMAWLTVVPALDILLLTYALIAWIFCKIFKRRTPKLKHTPRWVIYPTWA